jgi:hypothetical protein
MIQYLHQIESFYLKCIYILNYLQYIIHLNTMIMYNRSKCMCVFPVVFCGPEVFVFSFLW